MLFFWGTNGKKNIMSMLVYLLEHNGGIRRWLLLRSGMLQPFMYCNLTMQSLLLSRLLLVGICVVRFWRLLFLCFFVPHFGQVASARVTSSPVQRGKRLYRICLYDLWLSSFLPPSEATNPNTYPLQSAAMHQTMPKDSDHGDCLRQWFSLHSQKRRCAGSTCVFFSIISNISL